MLPLFFNIVQPNNLLSSITHAAILQKILNCFKPNINDELYYDIKTFP